MKKLQGEWGFKPDGVIGSDTVDAINAGPAVSGAAAGNRDGAAPLAARAIRPATRIDVNTAATFLDYLRDGQHVDHRNVVAGQPDKPTPQLQAPSSAGRQPNWTRPQRHRRQGTRQQEPGWLQQNQFVLKGDQYVQQSGPKNSLGLAKFDMQDDEAIYLHDTPEKASFGTAAAAPQPRLRAGENAAAVRDRNRCTKRTCLRQVPGSDDSGEEKCVKLQTEIPVRLLYDTAFLRRPTCSSGPTSMAGTTILQCARLSPGPPRKVAQPSRARTSGRKTK